MSVVYFQNDTKMKRRKQGMVLMSYNWVCLFTCSVLSSAYCLNSVSFLFREDILSPGGRMLQGRTMKFTFSRHGWLRLTKPLFTKQTVVMNALLLSLSFSAPLCPFNSSYKPCLLFQEAISQFGMTLSAIGYHSSQFLRPLTKGLRKITPSHRTSASWLPAQYYLRAITSWCAWKHFNAAAIDLTLERMLILTCVWTDMYGLCLLFKMHVGLLWI